MCITVISERHAYQVGVDASGAGRERYMYVLWVVAHVETKRHPPISSRSDGPGKLNLEEFGRERDLPAWADYTRIGSRR